MADEAIEFVVELAHRLPAADMRALAEAVGNRASRLPSRQTDHASAVLRAAYRKLSDLAVLHDPALLSGALLAGAATVEESRHRQSTQVVWTGPPSDVKTSRLTAAALVELINDGTQEILLVSYAAHTQPDIAVALSAAADRGAEITLLLERNADNPAYTVRSAAFPRLRARRLAWPRARRPTGAALHAKILVVDAQTALIGSANLTGYAMDINLECGVLLRGGPQPRAIRDHILSLLERHELIRL